MVIPSISAPNHGVFQKTIMFFVVLTWVALSPLRSYATDNASPNEPNTKKPVLVMLFLESPNGSTYEELLRRELELSIDTHQLVVEREFRFTQTKVSERIEEIRHVATTLNGDAVIWIDRKDDRTVTLQLVVMAPGQFTVRSVEADVENENIGELAIAARELLNNIDIPMRSHPPKASLTAPPQNGRPNKVASQASSTPQSAKHFLSFDAGISSAFKESLKSPILLTGTLGWGKHHPSGIQMSLLISLFGGSTSAKTSYEQKTFGVRPGGQLGVLWKTGPLAWGPFVGIQIPYQTARFSLEDDKNLKSTWWNLGFSLGVSAQVPFGKRIRIQVRPAIAVLMQQKIFKRTSDETTIFATPHLAGSIDIGILFTFQ